MRYPRFASLQSVHDGRRTQDVMYSFLEDNPCYFLFIFNFIFIPNCRYNLHYIITQQFVKVCIFLIEYKYKNKTKTVFERRKKNRGGEWGTKTHKTKQDTDKTVTTYKILMLTKFRVLMIIAVTAAHTISAQIQ